MGRPVELDEEHRVRVLERCEDCGVAVEAGPQEIDLEAELESLPRGPGDAVATPNRASWQASLGSEGWAAIDERPGRLLLTPRSLALLAERTGRELADIGYTRFGANQRRMWQTLLNGLTFHPNFAREVRAGRLRPSNARGRVSFAVDCVVTVLAAPLVLLVSVPLELTAALARRGGELVAVLRRR